MFCVSLDFFALNLALPRMTADLHTSAGGLQWVLSGYMLASGALMIAAGRLGDLFGHRRLLIAGVGLFGSASLLCGLAVSAPMLVACRVLQGAGVAFVMPVGFALLTHAVSAERRAKANGFVFGVAGIGLTLGPFVGGLLTQTVGWRWLFLLNVPLALAAILLASQVAETRPANAARAVDWPGLVTVTTVIAGVTIALDRGPSWGWTSPRTMSVLAAAAVLLAVFLRVESRVSRPLVDLALFRNQVFVIITMGGAIASAAASLYLFSASLDLQEVRHLSPGTAGVILLVPAVATAAAGPVAGRLDKIGPLKVLAAAVGLGGLAILALSRTDRLALYIPLLAVSGGALKVANTFTVIATQGVIRPEHAGEASGVTMTAIVTAGGVGIALAGSTLTGSVSVSTLQAPLTVTAAACLLTAVMLTICHCLRATTADDTALAEVRQVTTDD
ncbi:MFS transporter [Streptomyces sp. NPDC048191]|uniref:MFS transporter n=1 Tax=Streptomyces sp. NPDC048191 TaxID=3155484 RepID=UPI0033DF8F9C